MKYIFTLLLLYILKFVIVVLENLEAILISNFISKFISKLELHTEILIKMSRTGELYNFRPFELNKLSYRHFTTIVPKQRSGHRVVTDDSNLYCFGGFNPNSEINDTDASCLFRELWKFDLCTKKWTLMLGPDSNLPIELASNAMIQHAGTIMVYGGTGYPFGEHCSNKLYICQPSRNPNQMIEIKASGDEPMPLYGQGIVFHENYLYTVGGTEGFSYTSSVHRLNLSVQKKEWELVYNSRPDIGDGDPPGRYRHELVYDKKFIYILGGGISEMAFDLIDLPAFDLEKNTWQVVKTKPDPQSNPGYPGARKCFSCVQFETVDGDIQVVIAGGNDNRKFFRDLWKLELKTMQWSLFRKTALPFPLHFHDAASTTDGCMYIFGGIKVNASSTNSRINSIFKMWVTIPKLSHICFEALGHYYPHLWKRNKNELLELGIPSIFVNKLSL